MSAGQSRPWETLERKKVFSICDQTFSLGCIGYSPDAQTINRLQTRKACRKYGGSKHLLTQCWRLLSLSWHLNSKCLKFYTLSRCHCDASPIPNATDALFPPLQSRYELILLLFLPFTQTCPPCRPPDYLQQSCSLILRDILP